MIPKCRGKTKEGKWVYGWYIEPYNAGGKSFIAVGHLEHGEFTPTIYEVIPKTVGMSTGLKDKNDKEIYGSIKIDGKMSKGGDIVKGTSYLYGYQLDNGKQFDYLGFVYWCSQCDVGLCWMCGELSLLKDEPKEGYAGGSWDLSQLVHRNDIDYCTGEIIGNIHDNPELINNQC